MGIVAQSHGVCQVIACLLLSGNRLKEMLMNENRLDVPMKDKSTRSGKTPSLA